MASSENNPPLEKRLELSTSLSVNKKLKVKSKKAKATESCIRQATNLQEVSSKILPRQPSLVEAPYQPPYSRFNIDKKTKNRNALIDLEQSSACKIYMDSWQNVGIVQRPPYSEDHKLTMVQSHPRTQCFINTVPVYEHSEFNHTHNWPTNPDQNRTHNYTEQYFEQRFVDLNNSCTKNDSISSQCSTIHSTLNNITNGTQLSLPVYPPMYQYPPPVRAPINIPTAWSRVPMEQSIPPICMNTSSNQHIQPPRANIPNLLGIIKPPSTIIQNKFNLTPEVPGQIFSLPVFHIEDSKSNIFQEQNIANSNAENSKIPLSKFEELAKTSDYSKKTLLSVEIPVELPTKSLFPSYLTPPGGNVLRPLLQKTIQFPTPSNCDYFGSSFASEQNIISNHPYYSRGFMAQPVINPHSYLYPVVFNQAMTEPATKNMYEYGSHVGDPLYQTIQSGTHSNNQIHPKIEGEIVMSAMK